MLSIKNMSFKGKLLLYAASATVAALVLCGSAVMIGEWLETRRALPRNLGIQADMIAMNTIAALTFDDRGAAEETLRSLKADHNIILASIQNRDGTEFALYARPGSEHATPEPARSYGHRFLARRLHLLRPIMLDGEQIGRIYLQYDLAGFYENLTTVGATVVVGMLLALTGAALISTRLQRVLTRPITELADTAQAVAANKDYSVRAVKHASDELGTLTDAFNHMLARIEEHDDALRESHETLEYKVRERTAALAQRERQQAAVAELGQQALTGVDLVALCDEAVRLVTATLETEHATLLELLPGEEALLIRAGVGWPERIVGTKTVGVGLQSHAGYTLQVGKPVIVDDLRTEARFDTAALAEHGVISGMSVIIPGKDRPFGVLVAHTTQRRDFNDDDVHFLQSAANVLSEAIQQKTAEDGLRKLSVAVEQSPASIVITNREGTIEYVNSAFTKITGYSADEAIGRNPRLLKSGKWSEDAYKAMWDKILAGDVWTGEFENCKKNGQTFWEAASICPIRAADGAITHFLAVKQDITERKIAEEALYKSEARLRGITDSTQDGIVMIDPEGSISYWNPSAERMFGFTGQEAIGQNLHALIAPQRYHEAHYAAFAHYQQTGEGKAIGQIIELDARCKDGRELAIDLSLSALKLDDGWHAVGIVRDITERKMAEESLRRTEAELRKHRDHLEEMVGERTAELAKINDSLVHEVNERRQAELAAAAASRAKTDFLAAMSHEIRTPLNGILGMLDLLLATNLESRQHRFAWLAKSSGDTLLRIINDVLDFSKIEAGKLDIEHVEFDLHHAVETIIAPFSSQATAKRLQLTCVVHPDVDRLVKGDPGRVQQVLINLVGNALKFTDEGRIVVRLTIESAAEETLLVRFTVTDTGIGIPPDRAEQLFDAFTQADTSTTRKYGGTGLGLAICRRLVQLMNGEIGVKSEPNRGSTFWFTLPFDRVLSEAAGSPGPYGDLRNVRILVVHGLSEHRHKLVAQLAQLGFHHEVAADGEAALAMLARAASPGPRFDLALIAEELADRDGAHLVKDIKALPSIGNTPLALLTSNDVADTDNPPREGFAVSSPRPRSTAELLDVIVTALTCATVNLDGDAGESHARKAQPIPLARSTKVRVLVAEDNAINQEVVQTVLSEAGYACTIVGDGCEAVEALQKQPFDIVLMDCQMPHMDGYEATRAIRKLEQAGGLYGGESRRIPIVALTANALQGAGDECLAAGMDDYLSKPFEPQRLINVIESQLTRDTRFRGESRSGPEAKSAGVSVDITEMTEAPIDLDALLSQWGNKNGLVERLLGKFQEALVTDVARIAAAVEAGEFDQAGRLAHAMKGAASYVAAEALRREALTIEQSARSGDFAAVASALPALETEAKRCLEALPAVLTRLQAQEATSV